MTSIHMTMKNTFHVSERETVFVSAIMRTADASVEQFLHGNIYAMYENAIQHAFSAL